jgi:hypothetical protein
MPNKNLHTVFNSDSGRWENKIEGSVDPISTHRTKELATDKGEKISEDRKVEHIIHGKDGKIQGRNSYGNDPFPPRG